MAWSAGSASPSPERWGRPRGGRPWDRQILTYVLVATGVIIVLSVLAGGSSDLRFAVFVWVLLVASVLAFLYLYQREVKVPPLEAPAEGERVLQGELGRLAETLERADRGMRFSQAVAARRVRKAFLTRVRQEHGLTEVELDAVLAEPEEVAGLVKSPLIRAFLEDTTPAEDALIRGQGASGASTFRFLQGEEFTASIARVLEAMEAWG